MNRKEQIDTIAEHLHYKFSEELKERWDDAEQYANYIEITNDDMQELTTIYPDWQKVEEVAGKILDENPCLLHEFIDEEIERVEREEQIEVVVEYLIDRIKSEIPEGSNLYESYFRIEKYADSIGISMDCAESFLLSYPDWNRLNEIVEDLLEDAPWIFRQIFEEAIKDN